MKKKIVFIATLVVSLLMTIVSCSNASQIEFQDSSKPKFTDDGLSTITVKVGETPNYRQILPDNWTEEKKKLLFYKLTGKPTEGQSLTITPTATTKLSEVKNEGTEFSYIQIDNNLSTVTLDPIKWDLVLTAYQGTPIDGGELEIDLEKPVLRAFKKEVDLSTGEQNVVFDLTTYKPDQLVPTEQDSKAIGDVSIQVKFYENESYPPVKATLDIIDESSMEVVKSVLVKNTDKNPPIPYLIENAGFADLTVPPSNYKSITLATAPAPEGKFIGVKPGDYTFVATFYGNTDNDIYLQYMESIKIDGGNVSQAVIDIPEKAFNAPPTAPSDLDYSTYFSPVSGKLVINESKKLYAQEVVDTIPTNNILEEAHKAEATEKLNAAIGTKKALGVDEKLNRYNLVLTWKDNSFSEQGFKLNLKTTLSPLVGKENDIQIRWNPETKANEIYYTTADPYDTKDVDEISQIKVVEGSLKPGSETITISLPTGIFCTDLFVTAFNQLGENSSTVLSEGGTPNIGMYTIAYKLADPNMVETHNHLASVKVGPQPGTTKVYFVMAYNYGSEANLITSNNIDYPYIENDLYHFEGWRFDDPDVVEVSPGDKVITVSKLGDFYQKETAADDMGNTKGAMTNDQSNKNVEVYASWTTPLSIKVTFPSYSIYKDLKAGVQNPYNTIEPQKNKDGTNESVTLTIPTVLKTEAKIENMKFKLYDPHSDSTVLYATGSDANVYTDADGISETLENQVGDSTGGNSFVWDVTKFLDQTLVSRHGDIYRLNISYKYSKRKNGATGTDASDYLDPIIVDGNFFIKISK